MNTTKIKHVPKPVPSYYTVTLEMSAEEYDIFNRFCGCSATVSTIAANQGAVALRDKERLASILSQFYFCSALEKVVG